MQTVATFGRMYCMVSWIARPAVTTPPGELMYMKMSFFGFSDSRKSSWAVTRLAMGSSLAAVGLLDDDGDELRNDVLMVDHGKRILFCCAIYIGAKPARFKRQACGR